ncbi:enoyl-CoA hydratase-related protein [Ruegeria hyattellae]|uniref:enoyl-CoA hydratase-related protein n=1 Tax=Ruegeria hyattellae TaxID=3233337 RepID=UPI00355BA06A
MSLLLKSVDDNGVATLTLNRSEARNALSMDMRYALTDAFNAMSTDDAVHCVVLSGGKKFFAAGADIKEMVASTPVDIILREIERHWQVIAKFPKPLISAVNGYALGGGFELAMHADIIIAGESAQFACPEVRLGLIPGGGGTQRLVRAAGKAQAMRYLLTGDFIPAQQACDLGIISDVVPDEKVLESAHTLAQRIAALPPIAVRQIKEVTLAGVEAPLDVGLALERRGTQLMFATEDFQEGANAFLEKRPPEFKGR